MKTAEEILNEHGLGENPLDIEIRNAMREYAKQCLEEYRDTLLENLPRTSNNDMIKYRAKAGLYILNKDINHFIK